MSPRNFIQPGLDTSATSDKDFMQVLEWLRTAETSTPETEYRRVAAEDYNFYAGEQDDYATKQELLRQNRPLERFNEIKPKIDMLVGMAAQTKHDVLVVPVGLEDAPLAELMNGVLKHYRIHLKMSRKELECFEHTVKSGRSLLYFYVDKANPFEPKIKAKRIPGWSFYLDPDSREYDMSDARFLFIDKWLTIEEIKEHWPDAQESDFDNSMTDGAPAFFDEARKRFRVCECWYRKLVKMRWFQNPLTGKVESMTPREFKAFAEMLEQGMPVEGGGQQVMLPVPVPEYEETLVPAVHYMIFSGLKVREKGRSPYKFDGFPATLFGAYRMEEENRWFGAVTMMKDPQRNLNTMRRQLAQLLQTLPKGMLVHESGSVLNIEEYEQRSSDPTFHLELAPGASGKVLFRDQPQISPIYAQLTQMDSQSMKDASGIQDALMGMAYGTREPVGTVRDRRETGVAVLFILFDNFRESRYNNNKILACMVQQFAREPQLIRIEGQKGMELVQINSQLNPQVSGFNDISALEFDLEMSETIETPTTRQQTAGLLIEFSQNNPGMIPPDIILEYSDAPFTVKQRVMQYMQEQQEAQQKMQEREFALREAEVNVKAMGVTARMHTDKEKNANGAVRRRSEGSRRK